MIHVILIIIFVYLIYYFTSVRRLDKNGHYKKKKNKTIDDYDQLPSEAKYFIKKYNVDLNKINLRGLLKLIALILGIDIAIVTIIVLLIANDNIILALIIGAFLIIPIYVISLKFVGNYFKKKGLVKDEQNK